MLTPWFLHNEFGVDPDQWGRLVRAWSQGEIEAVYNRVAELVPRIKDDIDGDELWRKIVDELEVADFGRYGWVSREEAQQEMARRKASGGGT